MNVLSEMIDIINGFKKCIFFNDDDVNSIITNITVFYGVVSLLF